MRSRSLRTQFLLAGCLLVAATAASGVWSALTFARLSAAVGETLRDSQEKIDLTAALAGTLEREDDALLLSLAGETGQAREDLHTLRERFAASLRQLRPMLRDTEEQAAASSLEKHVEAYQRAGDSLLAEVGRADARELYHRSVNPALRQAVADCARVRELSFRSMERAGVRVRDEAWQATGVVTAISLAALVLSTVVAVRLARRIVGPVRELTRSVEAIRHDQLDQRVRVTSTDELGSLAEGFNRMAEKLADYRHSSLGELLQAKRTLEAALAALPDAVIVVDPLGQVMSMNPQARDLFQAEAAAAGTFRELPLTPGVFQAVEATLHGQRTGNGRADMSQALSLARQGRPFKFLPHVAPIPEFLPRRSGAVIVFDDVTEFVRLDELRSELVAVASHELKTPLTTLHMNLLLLEERAQNLTAQQREILTTALLGAGELAVTIDELLDLTRIEAGQLRLVREPVDLHPLIEQVLASLRPRFEDAGITLRYLQSVAATIVRGDAARLKIVFVNLLTNALKYTSRGDTVSVQVTSMQNAAGPAMRPLQLAVTDTGPGIPAEFRERVFEKFFRVEHHRGEDAQGVRGAGIGLYLCRQIIELHGGTIHCEPGDDGCGTRIAVELPVET
jgi:NtrC-family two-component system sensor histidine kinase KinB